MSTEERLRRLAKSHLIGDPEALKKELNRRLQEREEEKKNRKAEREGGSQKKQILTLVDGKKPERLTRSGRPYLIKKADKDDPIYSLGVIVGGKGFNHPPRKKKKTDK